MKNHCKEIIAIGDIHGRPYWRKIIERHPEAHFVFLGDYCDPYEPKSRKTLLHNLNKIIQLKQSHPEQVTLLLGNHDLHYFIDSFPKGSRYDQQIATQLKELFLKERELFEYAFEYQNLLFTHAGMSWTWYNTCWNRPLLPSAASCFNHPELMEDNGKALYFCGPYRFGLDPAGGIFWADEEELEKLPNGFIQIVGHNQLSKIRHIHSSIANENEVADLLICDCLSHQKYLQIDFSNPEITRFFEMNLKKEVEEKTLIFHTANKPL